MQIQIGKYYVNKTWKYLRPCLKAHGDLFKIKLDSVFKLAMGVHDCYLDGTQYQDQRLIYILLDRKYSPRRFESFLNWCKNQEYYVMDYGFDDALEGRKHMVVIKIPEGMEYAYDRFKDGLYSDMYTQDQIQRFITDSKVRDVLNLEPALRKEFADKVNQSFKTQIEPSDLQDAQLDFPLEKKKEYFNYRGR